MTSVVDKRKDKFNRYKNLRENANEILEPAIKTVQEYSVKDRVSDIADEGTFVEFEFDFPFYNRLLL